MPLNRHRTVLVSAAIAALIAAIYLPVLRFEFLNYDDPDYVTENRMVQQGISAEGVKWAFGGLHGAEHTYWHPLTWMSHMLDVQLFGLNPGWHHAMNVLFHMANSILLFLVLSNMTGAFWRSAAVAAVFAVHPLQVESVAWVTERKAVLSTMFWLLATAAYVKFVRSKEPDRLGRDASPYLSYIVCFLLFACGLMSKPTVVTFPCALLLLDFWPLKRFAIASPWRERIRVAGKLVLEKLPLLALSAFSAGITLVAHERLGLKAVGGELPMPARIQNAIVSYARYLKKIFFPVDLGINYPHPGAWPRDTVLVAALVLIVITVIVVGQLKKRPYLAVGWFWFIGVIVPAIGIVQVGFQAMADRFVYLPVIGVLIMIAWSAADLLNVRHAKPLAIGALSAGVLVYFASLTVAQLRHWKDSEAVFRRALAVTERNYIAQVNLSVALSSKGKLDEAELHARRALQIHAKDPLAYLLLGSIYRQKTNFPAAIASYSQALALNSNAPSTRVQLAIALLNSGQFAQAREHFQVLVDLEPYKAEAHGALGEIFTAEKNASAAIQHYREALKLRPDWPVVLNNLAWLLATNPDPQLRDGAEAVRLAQRACELAHNEEPRFFGTLAAACAEVGRFADAVAHAKRAQSLALEKGFPELVQRNAELLKLYEEQKPFHETQ